MEIKVYDFDKTIYEGDSSIDFFLFILLKRPIAIFKILPSLIFSILFFCLKKIDKERLKETYFSFLKYVDNTDELIEEFWKKNKKKLKSWYLEQEHDKDVIISASPDFLLSPMTSKIGVLKLIASTVDKKTGKFLSKNCYGEEKVKRLNREMTSYRIVECYSDSHTDRFLFYISDKPYLVKGNKLMEYAKKT